MKKLNVLDNEIGYYNIDEKDYISLTDMVRSIENGLALIERWLRKKYNRIFRNLGNNVQ